MPVKKTARKSPSKPKPKAKKRSKPKMKRSAPKRKTKRVAKPKMKRSASKPTAKKSTSKPKAKRSARKPATKKASRAGKPSMWKKSSGRKAKTVAKGRKPRRKTAKPSWFNAGTACLTGSFEGNINANSRLYIAKGAKCTAKVHAPNVHVDGTMNGTVYAKKTMKLGPGSHMHGTIVANNFDCANGASFSGTCKIGRYKKAA